MECCHILFCDLSYYINHRKYFMPNYFYVKNFSIKTLQQTIWHNIADKTAHFHAINFCTRHAIRKCLDNKN